VRYAAGPWPQITASEPVPPDDCRNPEAHSDVVPGIGAMPNTGPLPPGSVRLDQVPAADRCHPTELHR